MYFKGSLISPPEGFKFGFPKVLDRDLATGRELREWIVAEGYPASIINEYGHKAFNGLVIVTAPSIDSLIEKIRANDAEIARLQAKVAEKKRNEEKERIDHILNDSEIVCDYFVNSGMHLHAAVIKSLLYEFKKLYNNNNKK